MFQRIVSLVVTVVGVFFALLVGFWALLSLAFVAVGAAIVYAFRSRGWGRARKKHRGEVIEGEFRVLDETGERTGRPDQEREGTHTRQP
ncbi:MAG: hypothetical protein L0I62_03715 [Gammaproteobacteria bacterium]|nr:hypothetical protein [Gammaproteobacteria bacterium]